MGRRPRQPGFRRTEQQAMKSIMIGAGGVLGALARYGIGVVAGVPATFPYATLIANLFGCLLLGWLIETLRLRRSPQWMRDVFGTGMIGAFTTFSTFSLETVNLVDSWHLGLAVFYVLVSVWGGLLLGGVGYKLARAMFGKYGQQEGTII